MAETGTFNSKDYEIKTLQIINSGGQTVDVRNIFVELQIYQDIYSSVMNGQIILNDGSDIFSIFYLVGNEYLRIKIDKPNMGRPLERLFRIYKTTNRRLTTDSAQMFTLHFCSEELVSSSQILVSRSYKETKITNIIGDILTDELKVSTDRIGVLEPTQGEFNFTIPNYRPFEAIQWLTARAYDRNKFCYFFFENKNGYNLISLQTLFAQRPYKKLKYELKNVDRDPANNKDSIDSFEILNDFDMLTSITNGAFAQRMMSINVVDQSYKYYEYDLTAAEAQNNLMNKYKPVNGGKNVKGQTLFESKNSFFRTYLQVGPTKSEKDSHIKDWFLPRSMHMVMINHFKIRIVIPGDIELKAGDMVEYEFPLFRSANKAGKELDTRRTGKYMVASVNHKFSEDVFESIVELVSDSFSAPPPDAKAELNRLSKLGR